MKKNRFFITFLLFLPVLLAAQTPSPTPPASPVPGDTYSLTIGDSASSYAAVMVYPGDVYVYPGSEPLWFSAGEEVRLTLMPFPVPTPPPCGDAYYPVFSHWELDPVPSYFVDLMASQLLLIMDQDYVATPVIVTQVYKGPPCNRVFQTTSSSGKTVGQEFTTGLMLSLDGQMVAAYGFTITYDPVVITLDTSRGTEGVTAGPDGFISANAAGRFPGEVRVSGFDVNGKGPGSLDFLTFYWIGGPETGVTTLELQVDNLADENGNPIQLPYSIQYPNIDIAVMDSVLYGDVNGDQTINIVDALIVAQYTVGLAKVDINTAAADVNRDNTINIVDALIIAQYCAGLISVLPL